MLVNSKIFSNSSFLLVSIIINAQIFYCMEKILNESAYHKNRDSGETIPYFKNKIDLYVNKLYWPSKIMHEMQLIHLQYTFMNV